MKRIPSGREGWKMDMGAAYAADRAKQSDKAPAKRARMHW